MNTKFKLGLVIFVLTSYSSLAQLGAITKPFNRADTLRGTITPERAWWDVLHYGILVKPDFNAKKIEGKVDIRFKVLYQGKRMQIDLQQPLVLTKAFLGDKALRYTRNGNVYYLDVPQNLKKGEIKTLALR